VSLCRTLSPVMLETAIAVLRDRTGGVDADVEGRRTLGSVSLL
jgi:hypothetical protein